jgi:hypothetical protein
MLAPCPLRREISFRLAKSSSVLLVFCLLGGLGAVLAQQGQAPPAPNLPRATRPETPQTAAPPNHADVPGAGIGVEAQQPPVTPPQPRAQGPITKAQAKELFRSVDEILRFVNTDTGLPIKQSVKRKLITREAIENYIEKRIKEDKDTQKLERSQAILKKFGLLPPGYDLHAQFLRLLDEQVAAYYDAKTKTVNLLDWVPPDQQRPVLAHELTHALQDQKVDLQKWSLAGAPDDRPQPDNQEEVVEEAQAARQAVTEGQAMVVFLDYSLAPMGKDVLSAPEMVDVMRAGMGDSSESPEFSRAPMFLKESLLMPYTFGIDFVRYVLVHRGKDAAFPGMLDRPPADTRQVMQPETYLANEVVPPLKVPDLDKLVGRDYERYDFGEMGEFDVYLLTKQYAAERDPKEIYPHWRGGYYFAVHRKNTPKDQIALLYLSHWDSPEAAQEFARIYLEYSPRRYNVPGGTIGSGGSGDREVWCNCGGQANVKLKTKGEDLLILEDFDSNTEENLRAALLLGRVPAGSPSVPARKQTGAAMPGQIPKLRTTIQPDPSIN